MDADLIAALGAVALSLITFLVGRFVPSPLQPSINMLARALIDWIIRRHGGSPPIPLIRQEFRRVAPTYTENPAVNRGLSAIDDQALQALITERYAQLVRDSPSLPE